MSNKSQVKAIVLQDYNTALLGDLKFHEINPGGLDEACFKVIIVNASNIDVAISYDGTNAHDYIQDGGTRILDLQANAGPNGNVALMAKGTKVWVGSIAGAGVGYVSLIGYYQE